MARKGAAGKVRGEVCSEMKLMMRESSLAYREGSMSKGTDMIEREMETGRMTIRATEVQA